MTYTMTVLPAQNVDYVQPSFIVPKALVFEYESGIAHTIVDIARPIISEVLKRFPTATGDMYEVVIASKSKTYLFNYPTKVFVPADMHIIEQIKTMLQYENDKKEPKTWALKINFECIEKAKKQPKPRSRVQPPSTSMPKIDLLDVPQHLLFIASEGFKDQALEFERELSFVQPSSDRNWVKRRFVDGLDNWPHIKNADDALNGIISQALAVVSENPHFPPWWRSVAVSMTRGNPKGLIRSCLDVIDYTGDIQQPVSDDGIVDKNFRTTDVTPIFDVNEPLDFDVECPPSVPEDLWNKIPKNKRRDFIIEAAKNLRIGIHPVDTLVEFLKIC
ncbi:hypothetical protein [Pseudochrobactrum asaccharolyticum]|uniref:hypothetical protein n=1 Tax=Pseudochrobactrum asaccharolyticum TaxID=354351 RepID=UPI0040428646